MQSAECEIGGRYAATISLAPALRDLQRLGLVRQAPGRPRGMLEANPKGDGALQEYWNGLLNGDARHAARPLPPVTFPFNSVRPVPRPVRGARRAARRAALDGRL